MMISGRLGQPFRVASALLLGLAALAATPLARSQTVQVDITAGHATNSFSPPRALGAGVDGQLVPLIPEIYTPHNLDLMLSSGWGSVSYRLYTELSVQHWHWNPRGTWSDPAGQGYWTGDPAPGSLIQDSFGYRLPHRGFTHDQGNDDDYSRLDDGDSSTYWKSNPYLTSIFTGEADALHPQWVLVDLGAKRPIDAISLAWAEPHATAYQVQYWTGNDAIFDPAHGNWVTFPGGNVTKGAGGVVTLKLAPSPVSAEFIRVLMTASSGTCDTHGSADPRNCVGYAVFEMGIGTLEGSRFHDLVTHRPDNNQTTTYASSVDPWHEPSNRVTDQEQPGLDRIFTSGITRGIPAMVAVGMLYGAPQDAANELAYLEAQGYAISYVELGEEPDGQYILPEDYGALYLQWSTALHAVEPALKLGGPVFQGVSPVSPSADLDVPVWPDAQGRTSWLKRFLAYLSAHGRSSDLAFFSFETYPYSTCNGRARDLLRTPAGVNNLLQTWKADGLPASTPVFLTEYNVSFDSTAAFQDIYGALWHADFLGSLLTSGVSGAFYYEYEPTTLGQASGCNQWGAYGMFKADNRDDQIRSDTAQFFSTQLVTQDWCQPVDAPHTVYPAISDVQDAHGDILVTAYALLRPDGQWAVLLVNKDQSKTYRLAVAFKDSATGESHYFSGPVTAMSFGREQYSWHAAGPNGSPQPDGPAVTSALRGGRGVHYTIPAYSLTVLRGAIQ